VVNVRPTLDEHAKPMMAIEDGAVRADLERTRPAGRK
jgi:hypothetical protein